ncbi:MAG: inorganic phosphate transporter, partial [Alphaproteobacteria bacterium]|nr:inorganic phosphate transporter [Alphaproteobacteria bacterium]
TIGAWGYSPFLAIAVSFLVFKWMRFFLHIAPMSLLYRDVFTRYGLIVVGAFSGYALGANNVTTISAPYFVAAGIEGVGITALICIAVGIGFLTADKKVIKTVGSGLFPLTPLEALIVVFSGAFTLFLFSWGGLKTLLTYYGLPSFPLVPVPMTSAIIGSIIGVSFAKGGYGLKYSMLGHIVLSWVLTPILGGLICWVLMLMLSYGVI